MRFCPRCESQDIRHDLSARSQYGQGSMDMMVCKECGWQGTFFPEKG